MYVYQTYKEKESKQMFNTTRHLEIKYVNYP